MKTKIEEDWFSNVYLLNIGKTILRNINRWNIHDYLKTHKGMIISMIEEIETITPSKYELSTKLRITKKANS